MLLAKTTRELLGIQIVTTGIAVGWLALAVCFVSKLRGEPMLFMVQICVLSIGAFHAEWLFAGLERYGYIALRSVAAKVLMLFLIFMFVRTEKDYLVYAGLLAAGTILPDILDLIELRRVLSFPQKHCQYTYKRHIRPVLIFFAQTAAVTIYTSLDSAMLGFISGDYWVGIYDAAIKIKLILSYFITSLGTVLMPRFSNYIHRKQEQAFRQGIGRSMEFTILTGLSLMVFFFVMAPECIAFLFGDAFSPSAYVLRILMPTVFLIGCSNLTGIQILTPTGKERIVMYSTVAGAAVDMALNLLLIPRYAAAGAAFGTLAAEVVVLGVQIFGLWKLLPGMASVSFAKIAAAILLSSVLLPLVKAMFGAAVLVKLVVGAAAYFGSTAVLLFVWKEPLVVEAVTRIRRWTEKDNNEKLR